MLSCFYDIKIMIKQMVRNPVKIVVMSAYIAVCIELMGKREIFVPKYNEMLGEMADLIIKGGTVFVMIGGLIFLAEILSYPHNNFAIKRKLQKIGLKNRLGEVPILHNYKKNKKYQTYIFSSVGIPLEDWETHKEDIEAALNLLVVSMEYFTGHTQIEIKFVPASEGIPSAIVWKNDFLEQEEFVVDFGLGYTGSVCKDLTKDAHILIGGITGSGKTVLLKNILHQMLDKGAEVYIADFKGGIDYSKPLWHRDVVFIDQKEKVVVCLDKIIAEMDRRKQLFLGSMVANIKEYNMIAWEKIPHIVFACDELAELLDTTGLSKEEKAVVQEIDSRLSTLARLGRAFGIHLVLATQRPDANIVRGQIKNNMNIRICGKADQVLSQIILDNTSASTEIRGCQKGRFIMDDSTVFQGYWDEEV